MGRVSMRRESVRGDVSTTFRESSILPEQRLDWYKSQGRLTVVAFIICKGTVLFEKPECGDHWILPQGGINKDTETVAEGLRRICREELRFPDEFFADHKPLILGECLNPIPLERKTRYPYKQLIFTAVSAWNGNWINSNPGTGRKRVWVKSYPYLLGMIGSMADTREVKFSATCAAINSAYARKLLPWHCMPEGNAMVSVA